MANSNSVCSIVVIGASAGGVEAVTVLASRLPRDIDAALFVVLHLPPNAASSLPQILSRAGPLKAIHPVGRTPIKRGVIYVAPPDRHLVVGRGHVSADVGAREHGHRPAVNTLFRTAAESWGNRVIGVVLSGNLDDGTAGLAEIKKKGGAAIVQSPDETRYSGMPVSAIQHVDVDHVLPVDQMAPAILRLIDDSQSDSSARKQR